MIVSCPRCKTKFKIDDSRVPPEGRKLKCSRCQVVFLIKRRPTPPAPMGKRIRILVAHESETFCQRVKKLLETNNYEVTTAPDGIEAMSRLKEVHPQLIIIDVALPEVFGFEFCDLIRRDEQLSNIKIILVASVYDKTRLRREPESLYGADDYIEMHLIPKELVPKINKLLKIEAKAPETPRPPEKIKVKEEEVARPTVTESPKEEKPEAVEDEEHEKAKRLARIIVSDIMLYNQDVIEKGIREGNFYQLLEKDIEEGRGYYQERVPPEIRKSTDYLGFYLEEFINSKRKELGIGEA
ncbi:MAG: zinc-ribbon domain-containing protein [Deltaproteobacteria bacterium]|nr:MAG: zinc-ribbon domain-containing protein [Deltaproteobacteria bacterium]